MELIRGDVFSSMDPALGNALLHGIKHLLRHEFDLNRILMDKSKIDRAKVKVSGLLLLEEKSKAACIGVDSKIDAKTYDYESYEDEDRNSLLKKAMLPNII